MKNIVHFVVNAAIVKNNKILLVRKNEEEPWLVPGGHIKTGEDPTQTLKRKMLEELDIEISFLKYEELFNLGEDERSLPTPFTMFNHRVKSDGHLSEPHRNVGMLYLVTPLSTPKGLEGQQFNWFGEGDLQKDIIEPVKLISLKALELADH